MQLPTELDVDITAEPAEVRAAIDHLSDRERATLHLIHDRADDVLDLRGEAEAPVAPAPS